MNVSACCAAIRVSGPEARRFLQGQLTCDLTTVTPTTPQWGAHCNLKGRVEALYHIYQEDEAFWLVTPQTVAEHALKHLQHYARFSKVTLTLEVSALAEDEQALHAYQQSRIEALKRHEAILHPETVGQFLPQELGLVERGAVSFTKGCYLGQEIVARLHYRGQLKKELICIAMDAPIQPGQQLEYQGREGEVVDVVGAQALLLLKY